MKMVMLLCSQFSAKQDVTFLLQTLDACDCVVTVNRYLNLIIRQVHVVIRRVALLIICRVALLIIRRVGI